MVFDAASTIDTVKSGFGTTGQLLIYVALGFLIILMLAVIFVIFYYKKRWNLDVEFKLIRSDGKLVDAEIGKGYYNAKRGVVYIKRASMGKFSNGMPIRIFDIKRYLQGSRILTVIQVGPEDYRPVLNDSWTNHIASYKDDKTGEVIEVKESVLNIKIDSGYNKAWKTAWDAASKKAYSIQSFLQQFQTPIAIGIVIICCFVGFAILWAKIQ